VNGTRITNEQILNDHRLNELNELISFPKREGDEKTKTKKTWLPQERRRKCFSQELLFLAGIKYFSQIARISQISAACF
jgi:hypothetical protein